MHPRSPSPARSHLPLLYGVLIAVLLLAGCQRAPASLVSPAEATAPAAAAGQPTGDVPPAPTAASKRLPATWTPQPAVAAALPSPTPTHTATPHFSNTITASTAAWDDTTCAKYPDAWQIYVERSWRSDWCDLYSRAYSTYEYNLSFPSTWKVNLFGDLYPHLVFVTGQKGLELRLYQVYSYQVPGYSGTLEEAPEKAAFCDPSEKCLLIVDPFEQLGHRETRTLGARQVLVLDSQKGSQFVRRYFFQVLFTAYRPLSNRLFVLELYSPEQINAITSTEITGKEDAQYQPLLEQIEHLIGTLQQATNRP